MSFNDPIAELLTKIRNAKEAQHLYVDAFLSKVKVPILTILRESRDLLRIFLWTRKSAR